MSVWVKRVLTLSDVVVDVVEGAFVLGEQGDDQTVRIHLENTGPA